MSYYVNDNIKKTVRVFPMTKRNGYLRLDMNENPSGLPKDFIESCKEKITGEFLATYPCESDFYKAYSTFIDVNSSSIIATNGSDSAIRYVIQTFGKPGKNVVTVDPTFGMYGVNCSIFGLRQVCVPYNEDLSFDTQKLVNAIDTNTSIAILVNPNNPMGDAFSIGDAKSIIQKAHLCGAIVLIDEAYHYFYDKTFLPLLSEFDNVLVLRTFSKLFSLAALRLGVIIGNNTLIDYIRRARLTFETNSTALLFASELLKRRDIITSLINSEREGKRYLTQILLSSGYKIIECKANFLLIAPKSSVKHTEDALREKHKILIHTFNSGVLKDYIRVTTGEVAIMKKFYSAFIDCDKME